MPCPPDSLVTPAELGRYGVPAPFLRQFVPRAVQIKISTAGALGTMAVQHRLVGEEHYDPTPIQSSAASTWALDLDGEGRWLVVTFAAGTYVLSSTYTIAEDGTVTVGGGGISTVTAARYDLRTNGCAAATDEIRALWREGVREPVTAWGSDVRRHAAAIVHEFLRSSVGLTAEGSGVGDANVFALAAAARTFFGDIGASKLAPPGLVDTAPEADGPIWRPVISDARREW